jgi:Thaumatin family
MRLRVVVPVVLMVVAALAPSMPTSALAKAPSPIGAVAHHARRVTFANRTKQTIWVAGAEQGASPRLSRSGWKLAAGKSVTIVVPNKWNGRFWGRTGCHFHDGRGHCATGDCAGRFQCQGYGAIPATLAEWDMDSYDHLDFYDVSMVDGSNLPMYINITHGATKDPINKWGCEHAGCTTAVHCPKRLRVAGPACESPCAKLGGTRYCCSGKYAKGCSPSTTWPIDYATVWKRAEPYAYSWSGDDATSVFTCAGGCDYRITFGLTPKAHLKPPAK